MRLRCGGGRLGGGGVVGVGDGVTSSGLGGWDPWDWCRYFGMFACLNRGLLGILESNFGF